MKQSMVLFACLAGGCLAGYSGLVPEWMMSGRVTFMILALLVFQVGLGLGNRPDLKELLRSIRPKTLLLPVFTVVGTLVATSAAILLFRHEPAENIMAAGSGFGYYSLSSALIMDIGVSRGLEGAMSLATIALLANVMREIMALVGCSVLSHRHHGYPAIAIAGISSMDVCLPMISDGGRNDRIVPVAIIHGLCLEVTVPVLINLLFM